MEHQAHQGELMLEEFDYSEESRQDLFESSDSLSAEWVRCILSVLRPNYDDAKKAAAKKGKRLTKNQYNKACKDLGFKL